MCPALKNVLPFIVLKLYISIRLFHFLCVSVSHHAASLRSALRPSLSLSDFLFSSSLSSSLYNRLFIPGPSCVTSPTERSGTHLHFLEKLCFFFFFFFNKNQKKNKTQQCALGRMDNSIQSPVMMMMMMIMMSDNERLQETGSASPSVFNIRSALGQ